MEFLNQSAVVASAAVVLVHQILKLKIVPLSFANRYPVPTNIILSVIATIFVVNPHVGASVTDWLIQAGTIAVTAAIAYNQLLAPWGELKASEG